MTTSGNPFYYGLDDDFGLMTEANRQALSEVLSDDSPTEDWCAVADWLGYSGRKIESFKRLAQAKSCLPCLLMLNHWSKGPGKTVRVLNQALEEMGRKDAVLLLDDLRKRE